MNAMHPSTQKVCQKLANNRTRSVGGFAPVLQQRYRTARRATPTPVAQTEPEKLFTGEALPTYKKSNKLQPSFLLSKEDAILAQLKALQHNNFPTIDHGIEVCYRFAGFDPWHRSNYFGRSLDLGQFERFRRIFHTSCYFTLLNHTSYEFLSSLEVEEGVWKARVYIHHGYRKEEKTYEFTMRQRLGGKYDGVWYCDSLICEGCDDKQLCGII